MLLGIAAVAGAKFLQAQLAITEVMSQASINLGPTFVLPKSDFWELTNFGTNRLFLDGYSFSDRDSEPASRVPEPFRNCFIGPGESIIFLRSDTVTDRQGFFDWWGAGNLRPDLQVRPYPKRPGFDQEVDAVQLFDRDGTLVDRVDFGRALRGHTFVYEPQSGEFGSFSALGFNGAFQAAQTDDVGSPGVTTGPIPLSILEQPASLTEDAGTDVTFAVRAAGLPRPTYQWFRDGVALPATQPTLILTNIQPADSGRYTVRISNGLMSIESVPALLAVNTNPSPATIVLPPDDTTVFEGQTAVFVVKARGYPPPQFQWERNGTEIAGATNSSYIIPAANLGSPEILYSVRVWNPSGSTNASARLRVTRPPRLAITEVMASVAGGTTSGHSDWFELTNLDTNAVDLFGYRFSDRYSFELSFRITNALVIEPGESIIFVERMTPAQFQQWWGGERLPGGLKVIPYQGLGFSSDGDVINLWNGAETDPYSPVTSAAFLASTPGVSLRFLPPDYYFVEDSVAGVDGAFRAAGGEDTGSPGYLSNPPPYFVRVTRLSAGLEFRCRVVEGKAYALQTRTHLDGEAWSDAGVHLAEDAVLTIAVSGEGERRFFRLMEIP